MSEKIRTMTVNDKLALYTPEDKTFHPQFGEFKTTALDIEKLHPQRVSVDNIRNGDTFHWETGKWVVVRHLKVAGGKTSVYFCGSRSNARNCASCFRRQYPIECDFPIVKSKG